MERRPVFSGITKLLSLCVVAVIFFFIHPYYAQAAYNTTGLLDSTNLLSGQVSSSINTFTYTASAIPAGTTMQVSFSKDNSNWYNSTGTALGWNTMTTGSNSISLSTLAWIGDSFYYEISFTSDGSGTPVLDDVGLAFTSGGGNFTYQLYNTSGTLISTNILTGETVARIASFTYNASAIPANTGMTIQFSQDNTNWYNSSGTLNGTDTLTAGTNTIDLSARDWSGANLYYKAAYTSDNSATPLLDSVSVTFARNTLSGHVYTSNGTTPLGSKTVRVAINGVNHTTTATSDPTTGAWSIDDFTLSAGDVVTAYIEGATEDAVTVTVANTTSLSNIDLNQDTLIVRNDNSGSTTNANLATAVVTGSSDISNIYTISGSAITLPARKSLQVRSGSTFAPGGNITVGGSFTNSGTFTAGANTVTLNGATGTTQTVTSGSTSFYNLTHSGVSTAQLADTFVVTNGLTNSAGVFNFNGKTITTTGATISNTATIQATGAETVTGFNNDTTHGTIQYNGTSNQTGLNLGNTYNNLTINDGLVGYWKFDEGTGTTAADSSGYGNTGTLASGSTWSSSVPTLGFTDSYSVSIDGVNADEVNIGSITASPGSMSFWMKIPAISGNQGVIAFGDTNYNQLYIGAPGGNNYPLALLGSNYVAGTNLYGMDGQWIHVGWTWDSGTSQKVYVNGVLGASGNPGINISGLIHIGSYNNGSNKLAMSLDDVRIYNRALSATEVSSLAAGTQPASAVATYTLNSALTVNGDLTLASGGLNASGSNYGISVTGSWLNYGGVFTPQSDTVTLTSTSSKNIQSGGQSFYNLTQNGTAGTYTLQDALAVSNNLTITAGTLDVSSSNYGVTVGGTWSRSGTFTPRSGTLTLTGTSTFADTMNFYNVTINGSAKTVTLGANLTATNALAITAGTLDVSTSNYALTTGTWTDNGTFTPRSGTLTLTKTGTFTESANPYNLTINGASQTVTLGQNTTISNNLNIVAGTLAAAGFTMNVAGNWTNSGSFTHGSGTVTLNGTNQSVLGATTFYNLVKTVSSAATLTFEAAKTQVVAGLLTLQGAANQLLSVVSSIPGTQFIINPVSAVLNFLNIQDAHNSNATAVTANNSKNSGNNTNIIFGATTVTWTGATNTDWGTATNWDTGYIPNDTDNVVIASTANQPILSANITTNNLTINSSATLDLNGHNLTQTGTFSNNGTFKLQGGETLTGFTNDATHGTVTYYGTGTYASLPTGTSYNNLTFNGVAGTWNIATNKTVNGVLAITNGTVTVGSSAVVTTTGTGTTISIASGGTLTNNGGLSIAGAANPISNSGTWTNGASSTVTYTGQSDNTGVTVPNTTYYNVAFNKAGTVFTLANALTVSGNLTVTAGTLTPGTNTVIFNGTGTQTITSGGSSFYDVTHSGSGTVQLADAFTTTHSLTNSAGTFDLAGHNFTTTGASISNTATIQAQGGETVTGFTNDATHGTVAYNGSGTYTGLNLGNSYNNLNFTGTGTWTLTSSPSITTDLTLTSGTLALAGYNLTVPGTFLTGGTLQLNGTETSITSPTNLTTAGTVKYVNSSSLSSLMLGNSYYDFIAAGTGVITLAADITTHNLTINSGSEINFNNHDPSISGNFANAGTATGTSTRTFTLNGTTQTFNPANAIINTLLLIGSSGTVSLGSDTTITNLISIAAGRALDLINHIVTATTTTLTNNGTITPSSGTLKHTSSSLYFADNNYDTAPTYSVPSEDIYLSIIDSNRNLNGQSPDTFNMTVTAPHDSEDVTMTETGNATGVFRSSGLTTATYAGSATTNDGTLAVSDTDSISTTYTDQYDSSDTRSATATISTTARATAPTNLTGTPTQTSITWNWQDNSNNETGFKLYDASDSLIATISTPNTTSYVETGLTKGTSYTRKVVAYNAAGNSGAATATVSTVGEVAAPSNLTATANSDTAITWTWIDNSSNEDNFLLEDATGAVITTIPSTTTSQTGQTVSYQETGLSSGTTYSRKVIAKSGTYSSTATATVDGTTMTTATTTTGSPSTFSITTPANGTYTTETTPIFSWNKSAGSDAVDHYTLHIDTQPYTINANGPTQHATAFTATYANEHDGNPDNDTITVTPNTTTGIFPLKEGKHTWYVTAVDAVGNETQSSTYAFTVDITKPSIQSVSTTSPFTISVTDAIKLKELSLTFEKKVNTFGILSYQTLETTTFVLTGTKQTVTYTPKATLEAGVTYRLSLSLSDAAGNTVTGAQTFSIATSQQVASQDIQTLNPNTTPTQEIVQKLRAASPKVAIDIPKLEAQAVLRRKAQAQIFNDLLAQIFNPIKDYFIRTNSALALNIENIFHNIATFNTHTIHAIAYDTRSIWQTILDGTHISSEIALNASAYGITTINNGIHTSILETAQGIHVIAGINLIAPAQTLASTIKIPTIDVSGFKTTMFSIASNTGTSTLAFATNIFKQGQDTRIRSGLTNRQAISTGIMKVVTPVEAIANNISLKARAIYEIAFDKAPTRISNVQVARLNPTSATITWDTNHVTHVGKVNWGTYETLTYDHQAFEQSGLHTHHEVAITDLHPDTTYYFEVMSQDGNYVYDAYYSLKTPKDSSGQSNVPLIPQVARLLDNVNMHVDASQSSDVVQVGRAGQEYRAILQKDGWVSLLLPNHKQAWVLLKYVQLHDQTGFTGEVSQ